MAESKKKLQFEEENRATGITMATIKWNNKRYEIRLPWKSDKALDEGSKAMAF